MDPTERSNQQNEREFDFHFVTRKDEETKEEDGSTSAVKSEVVASRLKVIAKGGQDNTKMERLVFDLTSGKLTVERESESTQLVVSSPERQVIEGMVTSGWFARNLREEDNNFNSCSDGCRQASKTLAGQVHISLTVPALAHRLGI